MNLPLDPDLTERRRYLRRVAISLTTLALLGGIGGLVAVKIGEDSGVNGFCLATGYWGTRFMQGLLDRMTIRGAYITVSVAWFIYGALISASLNTIPVVVIYSIAYYAKRAQNSD